MASVPILLWTALKDSSLFDSTVVYIMYYVWSGGYRFNVIVGEVNSINKGLLDVCRWQFSNYAVRYSDRSLELFIEVHLSTDSRTQYLHSLVSPSEMSVMNARSTVHCSHAQLTFRASTWLSGCRIQRSNAKRALIRSV